MRELGLIAHAPWRSSSASAHFVARTRTPCCLRDDAGELFPAELRRDYVAGTVEPDDLPACVNVLMDGFYKDVLTLAAKEFSEAELEKLKPVLAIFNGFLKKLNRAFLSYDAGIRLRTRLEAGGVERKDISDAMMLALKERSSGTIVGVIEISQQPKDGKVPGDPRLPRALWMGKPPDVAYIANLAVLSSWRGRGLGQSLLRAGETAAGQWGFGEVYLHAATAEKRLLRMYEAAGYEALPSFDQPGWILGYSGREPTRFHRKAVGRGEQS